MTAARWAARELLVSRQLQRHVEELLLLAQPARGGDESDSELEAELGEAEDGAAARDKTRIVGLWGLPEQLLEQVQRAEEVIQLQREAEEEAAAGGGPRMAGAAGAAGVASPSATMSPTAGTVTAEDAQPPAQQPARRARQRKRQRAPLGWLLVYDVPAAVREDDSGDEGSGVPRRADSVSVAGAAGAAREVTALEHEAARRLQGLCRVVRARARLRALAAALYEQRTDPGSGQPFYLHSRTGAWSWELPAALRRGVRRW